MIQSLCDWDVGSAWLAPARRGMAWLGSAWLGLPRLGSSRLARVGGAQLSSDIFEPSLMSESHMVGRLWPLVTKDVLCYEQWMPHPLKE